MRLRLTGKPACRSARLSSNVSHTQMPRRVLPLLLVIACAASVQTVSAAELPNACGLLLPSELLTLGIPAEVRGASETRDGGQYVACTYRAEATGSDKSVAVVTVTVSAPGSDRLLQFGAMLQKALSENTAEQLRARGEFYSGSFMCKVQLMAPAELSRCVGTTATSVVTLAVSRSVASEQIVYPSFQLELLSQLAARVRARGG